MKNFIISIQKAIIEHLLHAKQFRPKNKHSLAEMERSK